jgi:hypothetical protein
MNRIFFVKSQRSRVGPHEPSCKNLIGKFGEVAFLERFNEIRADTSFRGDFVESQPLGFPDLFEEFPD